MTEHGSARPGRVELPPGPWSQHEVLRPDWMPDEGATSLAEQMSAALPTPTGYDRDALRACIDACQDCARAATTCADACLGEEMVEELAGCIRTLLNVADVCEATGRVLSRRSGPDSALTKALLGACCSACRVGRAVCQEFLPIHDHCRICARACRLAERACRALLYPRGPDPDRNHDHPPPPPPTTTRSGAR
jgi:hypothetical protein